MYTISVPVSNYHPLRRLDVEGTLRELKRLNAGRVLLCTCMCTAPEAEKRAQLAALRRNIPIFEANGLEVGVWFSSFGHGSGALDGATSSTPFTFMVGIDGEVCTESCCPLDPRFAACFTGWIADIARAGAQLILLDDDYRLAYRYGGPACCCELHMAEYQRRLGEPVTRAELRTRVYSGEANRYRDVWLDVRGDTLLQLAHQSRAVLDTVAPHARLGLCSVISTWDIDGVDAVALAKAMAGSTRPFLRTIGAPYWNVSRNWGMRLGDVIELTRMERWWTRAEDIELISEGDVYPRPRYTTPAAYLECFDTALRASGGLDGILKYSLDYHAGPDYEHGYIDRTLKNQPAYEWIDAHFADKHSVGVEVANHMLKSRNASLPESVPDEELYTNALFFPAEHKLTTANSIPVAYGSSSGAVIAFGENGKYIGEAQLQRGAILDMPAALHLTARGIDVGLLSATPSAMRPEDEHFLKYDEFVFTGFFEGFYDIALKPGAALESEFCASGSAYPGSYTYENAAGQRFLVYPFAAWRSYIHSTGSGTIRSYLRQRQFAEAVQWMGRPLPAMVSGNPDLYMLAKRGAHSMTIGLWNLHDDIALTPVVALAGKYSRIECYGGEAVLEGANVRFQSDIAAYAFAAFEVYE